MKAASHREWYRNLGNDPFPLAFRNAPPWVFERMRRPQSPAITNFSRRMKVFKAFLVANGHRVTWRD
jgi:hypothetical protein